MFRRVVLVFFLFISSAAFAGELSPQDRTTFVQMLDLKSCIWVTHFFGQGPVFNEIAEPSRVRVQARCSGPDTIPLSVVTAGSVRCKLKISGIPIFIDKVSCVSADSSFSPAKCVTQAINFDQKEAGTYVVTAGPARAENAVGARPRPRGSDQ